MDYEIAIYHSAFLKRAIETRLGDWRLADPIAEPIAAAIVRTCLAEGFVSRATDPSFVAFQKRHGVEAPPEYELTRPGLLLKLKMFQGCVSFSIPNSSKAAASVQFASALAQRLTLEHRLSAYDPQSGEVLT